MGNRIRYEWIALDLDEEGDIENMDHTNSFDEAVRESIIFNELRNNRSFLQDRSIELRKYYMDGEDIEDDTWAVWDEKSLSMIGRETGIFDDGSSIPKKFVKEVERTIKTERWRK